MRFTAVVTCHDGDPTEIINNLLTQTQRPDEILVYMSGRVPAESYSVLEDAPLFEFFREPDKEDWGHEKRAKGLDRARGEFIGWFNHDDAYEPTYVEEMLRAVDEDDADVAFCNWSHGGRNCNVRHNTEFAGGNSTSGNWIGRVSKVREVGYHGRDYSADAWLIAEIRLRAKIVKVEAVLYHHNP